MLKNDLQYFILQLKHNILNKCEDLKYIIIFTFLYRHMLQTFHFSIKNFYF